MTDGSRKIEGVYCPGEGPSARVGYQGVTEIQVRDDNMGTYGIRWFDVFKDNKLVSSFNAQHIEMVVYED